MFGIFKNALIKREESKKLEHLKVDLQSYQNSCYQMQEKHRELEKIIRAKEDKIADLDVEIKNFHNLKAFIESSGNNNQIVYDQALKAFHELNCEIDMVKVKIDKLDSFIVGFKTALDEMYKAKIYDVPKEITGFNNIEIEK